MYVCMLYMPLSCAPFCSVGVDGKSGNRKDAEQLHTLITQKAKTRQGQSAALYHGQVPYDRRQKIQELFNSGDIRLVVATGSSFGVGLDRPDIRHIIVFSLPKTFEDWYQVSGSAFVCLFVGWL